MKKFIFNDMFEPTLYLDFEDDDLLSGMEAISFVDQPATDIKWEVFRQLDESYNDYPDAARTNACRAIKYKERTNNQDCGTRVGWTRASQLCNGRRISVETISRMASFKRHQQHKDVPYDKGCGGMMWDAWGGDEGIDWAVRKMGYINNRLRSNEFGEQHFTDVDYEKRIVNAPVMLAETSIPRYSPELGKYWVKFSKETIERMMKKYFRDNKIHNVNTNHNPEQVRDGVYMIESYIVGDRNSSKMFPNIPDGSWVATFSVENDEVWELIKSGEYSGFSLEGFFIEKYEDEMINNLEGKIKEIINGEGDDLTKEQKIKNLLNIK
jgi:hypothetical protein